MTKIFSGVFLGFVASQFKFKNLKRYSQKYRVYVIQKLVIFQSVLSFPPSGNRSCQNMKNSQSGSKESNFRCYSNNGAV